MQPLVEKLRSAIVSFTEQSEHRWLLVSSSDADAPVVFKLLRDLECKSPSVVFLLFGVPFLHAEQYASAVVEQLVSEHRVLSELLVAQKLPPPKPLPSELHSGPRWPAQRLAAVIRTAEELIPTNLRLICALWPMTVSDPTAYRHVQDLLLRLVEDSPQQRARLIGRELRDVTPPTGGARFPRYVARAESDFSPAALHRCMQETIDDPQQPEAARVHALLMQATLDHAHGRADAAIARYGEALAYYQRTGNASMQAVVLLQLGEAHHKELRLSEARVHYERALAPAAIARVPVCVAQLARNLGDVAFLEQRYADAAVCYKTWRRVAEHLGDSHGAETAQSKLALAEAAR